MLRFLAFIVLMMIGFSAAIFSRFASLLFYLWFALFRPQEWVWMDISALRLSLILGILVVVPSLLSGILPNISHPLSVGALLFLAASFTAQFGALDQALGWYWLDYLSRLILVSLLAVTMISSKKRFTAAVTVIALSLGFHTSKAGLASILVGGVRFADGLAGAFADNNGYAMGTVMVLPLLVATAQNLRLVFEPGSVFGSMIPRMVRVGVYLSVPLSCVTVVSTFSRGGFLALVVSVLAFVALQKRRVLSLALVTVLLIAGLPFVPVPRGYMDRIQTIGTFEEAGETSALGRLHFWRVAIDMAVDRPLGVGLRNYEAAYDRYDFLDGAFGRARSVHSSHLQVLAEMGFAGLAIWTGLFLVAIRASFRIRKRSRAAHLAPEDSHFLFTMANALIVSMVGFLVGGAFIALALNDLTWLTFALVASLDRISAKMMVESNTSVSTAQVAQLAKQGTP